MRGKTALVCAAGGVGDILRVTPLVGVLQRLGHDVDMFAAPDYSETVSLLEGAPEIRSVFVQPPPRTPYDIAVFTHWAARWKTFVRSARTFQFETREWLQRGDNWAIKSIAQQLGWFEEMPAPFAMTSRTEFGLPPGTVAMHAGCKPGWPWKKWHGFEELARRFASVAVIGTHQDRSNARTYFHRDFCWPSNVRDFAGELTLRDTAALIRQSAALVSNDSGMMHLGVAVGTPTFGIFGLTSPQREAIPQSNMFSITKGLSCEPACRTRPWGRRDCDHHLECLKSLTAGEVYERMASRLPWI